MKTFFRWVLFLILLPPLTYAWVWFSLDTMLGFYILGWAYTWLQLFGDTAATIIWWILGFVVAAYALYSTIIEGDWDN